MIGLLYPFGSLLDCESIEDECVGFATFGTVRGQERDGLADMAEAS